MRNLMVCLVLFTAALAGCNTTGPVVMTEDECSGDADCNIGSYCDPFLRVCGWDCRGDTECGVGEYCNGVSGRCLREEELPPVPDHIEPVLTIEPGSLEDLTVLAGTTDGEFVRLSLRGSSDRWMMIPSVPTGVYPLSGFGLGGVLGEMKFRDERSRRILAGPINLSGAMIATETIFTEALWIPPHGELLIAVRADLLDGAESEFDLVLGDEAGVLFTDVRFGDGERVSPDLIAGNHTIVRHINVVPMATMTEGTTVLTVDFHGTPANLIPGIGSQCIAEVRVAAHGGSVLYNSIPFLGTNLPALGQVLLTEEGLPVGGYVRASTLDRLVVPLDDTTFLPDGESRTYYVCAVLDGLPMSREIALNVAPDMDAEAIDGRSLRVLTTNLYGGYQAWGNEPVITGLPLPYAGIANGLDQDLIRFQTSSRVPRGSLGVKSYSFAFVGALGGVRHVRVRVGSELLSRDAYQILYTDSGEEMDEDSFVNTFRSGFTVVFRDDLDIVDSGEVITIVGIPSGFGPGDSFTIRFAAQTYFGTGANVTARGTLTRFAGDEIGALEPVVWTDRALAGVYNGMWLVHGPEHMATFVRY